MALQDCELLFRRGRRTLAASPAHTALNRRCAAPGASGSDTARYATFFWDKVHPYIQEAARFLRATQDGKQWLANLHSHVFQVEHNQE